MTYLLPVIEVNFGRGETSPEFLHAVETMVHALMSTIPSRLAASADAAMRRMVTGISELDESDKPPEHSIFNKQLPTNTHLVGWNTLNPITVGGDLAVSHPSVKHASDGVAGFSPAREIVSCETSNPASSQRKVEPIHIQNGHAPINRKPTDKEQKQFHEANKQEAARANTLGSSGVAMGDWNKNNYGLIIPKAQTVVHAGLDYIQIWEQEEGAKIDVVRTSSFNPGIDKHLGHVAILAIS